MALLDYFKAQPTEYILAYANGRIFRQGEGRAFWYWSPSTSIALIPIATTDSLFVFNEASGNFQAITYRITEPQTLATLLNFTINPRTRKYQSNDPEKLNQRIINIIQRHTRRELQQLSLEDALRSSAMALKAIISRSILARLHILAWLSARRL